MRVMLVGQGGLAVSISSVMFVLLMFFRLAMKTSLCRGAACPSSYKKTTAFSQEGAENHPRGGRFPLGLASGIFRRKLCVAIVCSLSG